MIVELHNWRYMVQMGFGHDSWQLTGKAFGHPKIPDGDYVCTSTPVKFDREKMQVETFSGRVYQLYDCGGNLEEQIKYLEEDIARSTDSV